MIEVGKIYTGNKYCFQGTIEVLSFNPDTNEARVRLNLQGTVWEETWDLDMFENGLLIGEYREIEQ